MSSLTLTRHNIIDTLELPLFDQNPETSQSTFIIDNEEKASWAASRYLAALQRIEARESLASVYKKRIEDWLERANKEDQDCGDYMKHLLRPWVEQTLRNSKTRSRSLHLLGARVGLRRNPDRVEIQDVPLAVDFCEMNLPEAVIVKRDVSKTILKEQILTGQVIPGVELVPGDEELSIKEE